MDRSICPHLISEQVLKLLSVHEINFTPDGPLLLVLMEGVNHGVVTTRVVIEVITRVGRHVHVGNIVRCCLQT